MVQLKHTASPPPLSVHLFYSIPISPFCCEVCVDPCTSPRRAPSGNIGILCILLASVSRVVSLRGAKPSNHLSVHPASQSAMQSAGPIHYKRHPHLDPVTHLMAVCVCEKEKVPSAKNPSPAKLSLLVFSLYSHTRTCLAPVYTHTLQSRDEGFHILLKFSTRSSPPPPTTGGL